MEHTHEHDHEYLHAHGIPHGHVHENQKAVINRLARAIGHLEKVKRMVEEGYDCSEVLIQLCCQVCQLLGVGGVVTDHVVHQRQQLLHGSVLAGGFAAVAVTAAVVAVGVLVTVGVEMLVVMGMGLVVAVGVRMLRGVGMTVVGVGMGMLMVVTAAAAVIVMNMHRDSLLLSIYFSPLYAQ